MSRTAIFVTFIATLIVVIAITGVVRLAQSSASNPVSGSTSMNDRFSINGGGEMRSQGDLFDGRDQ